MKKGIAVLLALALVTLSPGFGAYEAVAQIRAAKPGVKGVPGARIRG